MIQVDPSPDPILARSAEGVVLAALAGGSCRSAAEIAGDGGLDTTAVRRAIFCLRRAGAPIATVRGRGYRSPPFVPLDRGGIVSSLPGPVRARLSTVEVAALVDSTNARLCGRPRWEGGGAVALIAEGQTAGRGRRGRSWLAPPGAGLPLSLSWWSTSPPSALATVGMAAGVAVVEALGDCGYGGIGLKWPNDLLTGGRKLGGILVETAAGGGGGCRVVVGVGINIDLAGVDLATVDQPVVDLAALRDGLPDRNLIAAALLSRLVVLATDCERGSAGHYLDRWRGLDIANGREVVVRLPQGSHAGRACGIDSQGRLLVERQGAVTAFSAGEVSMRVAG